MIKGRCPVCDQPIEGKTAADLPFLPFCGERCRLIDLGRWLGDRYKIPATESGMSEDPSDEPTPPP